MGTAFFIYIRSLIKGGIKNAQQHPFDLRESEVYIVTETKRPPSNRFKRLVFDMSEYFEDRSVTFEDVKYDMLPEERAQNYSRYLIQERGVWTVTVTIPGCPDEDAKDVWDL